MGNFKKLLNQIGKEWFFFLFRYSKKMTLQTKSYLTQWDSLYCIFHLLIKKIESNEKSLYSNVICHIWCFSLILFTRNLYDGWKKLKDIFQPRLKCCKGTFFSLFIRTIFSFLFKFLYFSLCFNSELLHKTFRTGFVFLFPLIRQDCVATSIY